MHLISLAKDDDDLLDLYGKVVEAITDIDVSGMDIREINEMFVEISCMINDVIIPRIQDIIDMLNGTDGIEKEKSAFDDFDAENGYEEQVTDAEVYESHLDAINSIIQIAMNQMHNSYKECLDSDLEDLLDYTIFQIEYTRKTSKE